MKAVQFYTLYWRILLFPLLLSIVDCLKNRKKKEGEGRKTVQAHLGPVQFSFIPSFFFLFFRQIAGMNKWRYFFKKKKSIFMGNRICRFLTTSVNTALHSSKKEIILLSETIITKIHVVILLWYWFVWPVVCLKKTHPEYLLDYLSDNLI